MAVKKAVQCGNVEDAIEKVNDLNPEVGYPFLFSPNFRMMLLTVFCTGDMTSFFISNFNGPYFYPISQYFIVGDDLTKLINH